MTKVERIWIDIETTNLDPATEFILEIGIALTDKYGNWIDGRAWLLPPSKDPLHSKEKENAIFRAKEHPFVGPMHTKSGLWHALKNAGQLSEDYCEELIIEYLEFNKAPEELPMCGSSVHFDRAFIKKYMPSLDAYFSHRNIDNSSTKELCRDLNPEVYAKLSELQPMKHHRALHDLRDTIDEYKFYIKNFLKVEL